MPRPLTCKNRDEEMNGSGKAHLTADKVPIFVWVRSVSDPLTGEPQELWSVYFAFSHMDASEKYTVLLNLPLKARRRRRPLAAPVGSVGLMLDPSGGKSRYLTASPRMFHGPPE